MPILTNSRQEKSARLLAGAKTHIDICSGVRRRLPMRHQRQRSTRDRACRSCVNLPYGLLVRTAGFNTCSHPWRKVVRVVGCRVRGSALSKTPFLAAIMSTMPCAIASDIPRWVSLALYASSGICWKHADDQMTST